MRYHTSIVSAACNMRLDTRYGLIYHPTSNTFFAGGSSKMIRQEFSRLNRGLRLWALLILMGTLIFSQSDRGRISGFVRDPGGLFVVQAAVTATNESNGMRISVSTNEAGYYQFPYLPPGSYTISVEASGFKKFTVNHVKLDAASQATVDAALLVGDVTESVQVLASSSAVQTETAQVGRVVESTQISDLTLN